MKQEEHGRPFIIWTLQRTGGTNLAKCLMEYSGLLEAARTRVANGTDSAVQWLAAIDNQWKLHEPFNAGDDSRAFGKITENWLSAPDNIALEAAVDEICTRQIPMKHCVEMVPWEISEALAKSSTRHGYRHLFLHRENAADRLLSLHYAELTGIWGTHSGDKNRIDEEIFSSPLPIKKLVEHETICNAQLTRTWQLLESLGANPAVVAFEDIYGTSSFSSAQARLLNLLALLDQSRDIESDKKLVTEIIRWGDQGTKRSYAKFKGIGDLKQALKTIPVPLYAAQMYQMEVEQLHVEHTDILHAAIDVAPEFIQLGQHFDVAGVVVLKEALPLGSTLNVSIGGNEREIRWGILSPAITRRFPSGVNSANARFKFGMISYSKEMNIEIFLKYPDGEKLPLFKLKCGAIASQNTDVNEQIA